MNLKKFSPLALGLFNDTFNICTDYIASNDKILCIS